MKFNLKHFSYLLLAAGMILTGCSKSSTEPDQPEQELSSNNSLNNFSFKADKNSSISVNASGVQGSGIIYVTVKEGVALNALVPTFKIHEKAVAKIGGTADPGGCMAHALQEYSWHIFPPTHNRATVTYDDLSAHDKDGRNGYPWHASWCITP